MPGKPKMPMLISPVPTPGGQPVPVEVVFLYDDSVVSRSGRLMARRGLQYEVELNETPPELVLDLKVVLSIQGSSPKRLPARLSSQRGRRVTIEARGAGRADKRRFPRLIGAIGMRWRHLRDDAPEAWHEPDPLMNFSVVGFAFGGGSEVTQEGDLLVVDFQVGGVGPRYEGLVRVVRVAPRDEDEALDHAVDENHEISVEIVEAPPEAREALANLTLRIQRALTDTGHRH